MLFSGIFAAEPQKVSSEIKQATVFLQGAVLRNTASATVSEGRSVLLFTGLSYNILRESIRIKPENCRIQSVTLRKNFMDLELQDKKIKALQEEMQKLNDKKTTLSEELDVYAQEKEMVLSNKSIGGQDNGVDPEKLKAAAEFFRQRLSDILSRVQAIQTEINKADKRIAELSVQINESAAKNIYPTSEVEVSILADKAGTARFDIEYFISEAGWFPAYDFRVNDLSAPMELGYIAHIYQNSGLDWKNVEITVSSADPGNNGGAPIPKTWFISQSGYRLQYDVQKPQSEMNRVSGRVVDETGGPIAFANILVENSSAGTSTDFEGRFSMALPQGATTLNINYVGYEKQTLPIQQSEMYIVLQPSVKLLQSIVVAQNKSVSANMEAVGLSAGYYSSGRGSRSRSYAYDAGIKRKESGQVTTSNVNIGSTAVSVEYTLKDKMNVPSDGRPYTADILKREILAEHKYSATPKISKDAYLSIFIPEWEKLNLLEGEVSLYFGNSYTGKTAISLANLKDSLEFSMGKDPNIKIQRTLTSQKTTGGGILPNKTGNYEWSSEIRNTGKMPVRLTVTEPFPVSTEKEIKVDLAKELSGATVDKEKGLLTWELNLQPGEQKKLQFGFSVTYPKNLNMRFE